MTMKKTLLLLLATLLLGSCVTGRDIMELRAQREMMMRQLRDSLDNRSLTVDFDYMIPRRIGARHISYGYSVTIKGDTLRSRLPYFGVAYRTDWGSADSSPLDFEGRISEYNYTSSKQQGYRLVMVTHNRQERIVYQLELFANGRASLDVLPTDRETVSFAGNIRQEAAK